MSDDLISTSEDKLDFLEYWKFYKKMKSNEITDITFDVNAFNQGTITRYYETVSYKYTKEQIRRFLEKPEIYERQLREVSLYLYAYCQEYKNLLRHFDKMLVHEPVLVPIGNLYDLLSSKAKNNKFLKSYYANLDFIENYNFKIKFADMESIVLREDLYFGYEKTDGENYIWQQLPSNYCRILGWDEFGNYTMEFDFTYFTKPNVNIDNFAPEFKIRNDLYKEDTHNNRWQKLSDNAIVFKFDRSILYGIPHFCGIFDELISLSEYKDLQETTTRSNNFKLIHQKIPQNLDKDAGINKFMIDDKAAVKFHNNLKSNLPEGVGCATTPMPLTEVTLKSSQFDEDLVGKAEKNMFTSAGVSKLLYSDDSNGSIGLNRSIEFDASLMFNLLRQEELFMKKRLKRFNANSKFNWKMLLPDVTVHNVTEYKEEITTNAQFGYSKFCSSMNQADLLALLYLEKELGLSEIMIPLQSAHTASGGVGGDGGRPKINPNKKADSSIKVDDLDANKNRAK